LFTRSSVLRDRERCNFPTALCTGAIYFYLDSRHGFIQLSNFSGEWYDDRMHGKGVFTAPDGSRLCIG
jgi:hypothetical protein